MGTRRYSYAVAGLLALIVVACGDNVVPATVECTAPEITCAGGCTNPLDDESNCGQCGNVCGSGQVCVNGDCQAQVMCGSGQTDCNNQCVDTRTDETNCGACGKTCAAGQTCANGTCETTINCTAPQINCNNVCVDPRDDEANCGSCGNTCTSSQTCVATGGNPPGECQTTVTCTPPTIACNNVCIDPRSDEANCGTCGNTCPGAQQCFATGGNPPGSCQTVVTCTGTQIACNNVCIEPSTDENNCGTCGNACPNGQACTPQAGTPPGACMPIVSCTAPEEDCDNICINTQTSDTNCGSCGNACSGSTPDCVAGVCNPICSGSTPDLCNMACTDFDTDEMNCGGCGSAFQCALDGSETCVNGVCEDTCAVPTQFCGADGCIDTTNNNGHCGACNSPCPMGTICSNNSCVLNCTNGTTLCGNQCVNTQTDALNCGGCGNQCTGGKICSGGGCVCPPGRTDCNGTCVNTLADDNNCGPPGPASCGNACLSTENCVSGVCELDCTPPLLDCGGAACVDPRIDEAHCGGCNQSCDDGIGAPGETQCVNSQCVCTTPGETKCGDQCVNTQSDNANCGGCGNVCNPGTICSGGMCQLDCGTQTLCNPPNVCVNLATDPEHCGMCNNSCGVGGICTTNAGGMPVCGCPSNIPDACPGLCTNFQSDPGNCGNCGVTCNVGAGETCSAGMCCPAGTVNCNGQCVNTSNNPNACGGCGPAFVCDPGEVCTNGVCECPFGQNQCVPPGGGPPVCKVTVNDPNACGPTCQVCSGATPFCVSNGCAAQCPAPLEPCGNQCVNKKSSNEHCGACNNQCPMGTGCSNGTCIPNIQVGPDPAKCANGGPPIDVPTGGGDTTCTGSLAGVTFRFGLCSCTNVGPLGHDLTVDAFDSRFGPYVTSPTSKRMGGGIGVNGTIQSTANIEAFGDFWVFGAQGQNTKGEIRVHDRFFNKGRFDFSRLVSVNEAVLGSCSISGFNCFADADCGAGGGTCTLTGVVGGEDAWIGGAIKKATGGNYGMNVSGVLTTGTTACNALAGESVTFGQCAAAPFPTLPNPCDCASDELIPVRAIVDHFRTNNDNALIGLSSQALNGGSSARLDLPCGVYYFDQVNISQATTIVVHGRTAIAIGGSIVVSQPIIFDLDPDATLDVFVAGVVKASQDFTLGNPAFPRLSRMYIGSPGCSGSGSCTVNADCCSGVCQANGICMGGGGGNISEAFSLSGSSFLNGLMYAGFGTFRVTNPLVMYGAIFANYYDSVRADIHFDKGAVDNSEECPPPPTNACDDCRDCDNQACIGGQCALCQQDADCCAPLRCNTVTGSCEL